MNQVESYKLSYTMITQNMQWTLPTNYRLSEST